MPTGKERVYETTGKLRLSVSEKREIQREAALNDMTFSDFVRMSVYGYMAEVVRANRNRYTEREYTERLERYMSIAENIRAGRHSHAPFREQVVAK